MIKRQYQLVIKFYNYKNILMIEKFLSFINNIKYKNNFIAHNNLNFNNYKKRNSEDNIILSEFNNFQCNHIGLAYLLNGLKKKFNARINAYYGHILLGYQLDIGITQKIKIFLAKILKYNFFGVYNSLGVRDFIYPLSKKNNYLKKKLVNSFKKKVKNLNQLQYFSFNKVLIGDLIYDTYLKNNYDNIPTISITDKKFQIFLDNFFELFIFWVEYFNKNKVKAVVSSHSCYSLAIPLRIANSKQIDAFVLSKEYLRRIKRNLLFQNSEAKYYKSLFSKIPNKKKKQIILEAKTRIKKRISGSYSGDYIYMTKSPFKSNLKIRKKKVSTPKVLIATHDYVDAPHALGFHIFPDFYTWFKFTCDIASKTNFEWYVKTHPRFHGKAFKSLDHERFVTEKILEKYPNIKLLPQNVSHNEILNKGINAVISVTGTISMDYALYDVPTILASTNNPFINYNFSVHSKNVNDYKQKILNLSQIIKKKKIIKKEIYEFYAMKNIYFSKDWIFKDMYNLAKKVGGFDSFYNNSIYDFWINNFDKNFHKQSKKNIENFLKSKKAFFINNGLSSF
tara:strand:- start:1283 stop:2974 length:1692 start_codon:yes stop_codon:yes gene_type:complete